MVAFALGGTWDVALAAPTPIAVAEVTQVELQDPVNLVGSVLPRRNALVSAQVNGLIEEVWVDEGSRVDAGDPLFQLDAELARIGVARSAARLRQARAELKETDRQLREAGVTIRSSTRRESLKPFARFLMLVLSIRIPF